MNRDWSEVTLDIEKLAAMQIVDRAWLNNLELRKAGAGDDWIRDTVSIQMIRHIAMVGGESVTVPEIRVPDGLWQGFKERYLPTFHRWSPVRYRTLQREQTWRAAELLPNIDLPEHHRHAAIKVMVPR